jgi:hypothetical protein
VEVTDTDRDCLIAHSINIVTRPRPGGGKTPFINDGGTGRTTVYTFHQIARMVRPGGGTNPSLNDRRHGNHD